MRKNLAMRLKMLCRSPDQLMNFPRLHSTDTKDDARALVSLVITEHKIVKYISFWGPARDFQNKCRFLDLFTDSVSSERTCYVAWTLTTADHGA